MLLLHSKVSPASVQPCLNGLLAHLHVQASVYVRFDHINALHASISAANLNQRRRVQKTLAIVSYAANFVVTTLHPHFLTSTGCPSALASHWRLRGSLTKSRNLADRQTLQIRSRITSVSFSSIVVKSAFFGPQFGSSICCRSFCNIQQSYVCGTLGIVGSKNHCCGERRGRISEGVSLPRQ